MIAAGDRVKETALNVGLNDISLLGNASDPSCVTFVFAGLGGETIAYTARHRTSRQWEVGIGVVMPGSPDLITRVRVLSNSLGTTDLIDFDNGIVDVWDDAPAGKVVTLDDDSDDLSLPADLSVAGNLSIRGVEYVWPSSVSAGKFLSTDASGNLSWTSILEYLSLGDLDDVELTAPAVGQALMYDGSKWINTLDGTALNVSASNLTTGTVPSARVSGAYSGITGLGTIVSGIWQGTSISTSYTDAKIKTVTGTANRLSIGGTSTDPTFDVSTSYAGQATITTLGAVATGAWQATQIADTYLATISTAGKVSNSATSAVSTNTVSTIVLRDASGNFSAGTITATLSGSISGNAATATALQTARAINGVNFDGTAAITVTAAAGTLTGATLASNVLASSLTSVGTLAALTVTAPIAGSVTGSSGSTTGNAATATALQTARLINGVSFDGTANITVTAAAGTLTGTTLNATVVTSSLTALGTIATGVWQGTAIANAYIATGLDVAKLTVGTTLPSNVVSSSLTSFGTIVSGAVPASLITAGTFGAGAYVFPSTLATSGALSVNATSVSVNPGADASGFVLVGSGGAAPTGNRIARLILDVPDSVTFRGQSITVLRRNGTTTWTYGLNSGISGTMGAISDLFFESAATGVVMALTTAGALTLAAGLSATTGTFSNDVTLADGKALRTTTSTYWMLGYTGGAVAVGNATVPVAIGSPGSIVSALGGDAVLANNRNLRGANSGATATYQLIGITSGNTVSLDADARGITTGGALTVGTIATVTTRVIVTGSNGTRSFQMHNGGIFAIYNSANTETWRIQTTNTNDLLFAPQTSGIVSVTSSLSANSFVPTSSTVPTDGMYLSGTNTLAWATNSTRQMYLSTALTITASNGLNIQPASGGGDITLRCSTGAVTSQILWYNDASVNHSGILAQAGTGLYLNTVTGQSHFTRVNGVAITTTSSTGVALTGILAASGNVGAGGTASYRIHAIGTNNTVAIGATSVNTADDIAFYGSGTVASGNLTLLDGAMSAAGIVTGLVRNNNSASATASAKVGASVSGASAGDPYLFLGIAGVQNWFYGIDNSDSDKLKFGIGDDPSSGTAFATFTTAGVATFVSSVSATAFIPTSSTVPTNGLYLGGANQLAWATNSVRRMYLDTNTLGVNAPGGIYLNPPSGTATIEFVPGSGGTNTSLNFNNSAGTLKGSLIYSVGTGMKLNAETGTYVKAQINGVDRLYVDSVQIVADVADFRVVAPSSTDVSLNLRNQNAYSNIKFQEATGNVIAQITGYGVSGTPAGTGVLFFNADAHIFQSGYIDIQAGYIKTQSPGGGAGAWKLGIVRAGVITADLTRYVEVDIGGSVLKFVIAA